MSRALPTVSRGSSRLEAHDGIVYGNELEGLITTTTPVVTSFGVGIPRPSPLTPPSTTMSALVLPTSLTGSSSICSISSATSDGQSRTTSRTGTAPVTMVLV